ncbi:DNA polymerase sigma-like protein [Trypanosoma theileri]|uniref:DNA polymerase sigma-like protein n=1 Tax=Trypanosoma theileri TaxID=67003 RepID=A0A1X0NU61_9TRYP|nr:DNA polymerase sigma-like protein [Trypanosoma theileri]ORC87640.1 DNA polymerase sigma-like protein [Trypanosoma theileri]
MQLDALQKEVIASIDNPQTISQYLKNGGNIQLNADITGKLRSNGDSGSDLNRNANAGKRRGRHDDNTDSMNKRTRTEVRNTAPVANSPSTSEVEGLHDTLPLETAFLTFLEIITPTSRERRDTEQVLQDLGSSLFRLGWRVDLFGSWYTGLCIPSSDVDFVASPLSPTGGGNNTTQRGSGMQRKGVHNNNNNNYSDGNLMLQLIAQGGDNSSVARRERRRIYSGLLRSVANALRFSPSFHSIQQIAHAKVPIVKAQHCGGKKIDVSFLKDGQISSRFLCQEFLKPQFRLARGLTILVKALVANWRLDDPSVGGLGSFPTSVMVLWFLHAEVADHYPPECRDSYAVCLVGFLKYYSMQFDHKRRGIDYANKRIFDKPPSSELCVMNPLMPHANCSVAASLFSSRVVPKFRETYERLSQLLEYTTDTSTVEKVVLSVFSRSINAVGGSGVWRQLYRRKRAKVREPQHLWDERTCIYAGDPIGS